MSCMQISHTINVYTHCHNRAAFLFLWPAHMKTRLLEFVVFEFSVSPLYLCNVHIVYSMCDIHSARTFRMLQITFMRHI